MTAIQCTLGEFRFATDCAKSIEDTVLRVEALCGK